MAEDPDYLWNAEDWETTVDAADLSLLTDDMQRGDVMRLGRAVKLPDTWIVRGYDGQFRQFLAEADARAYAAAIPADAD